MKTAFDEIRLEEYSPAFEAAQLGMLLINRIEEHSHLRDASVGYAFRDDELRRQGRTIYAEAILVERILQSEKRYGRIVRWALLHHILKVEALPDFLVLIDRNIWEGMDPESKLALIDHELMHCWFMTEDDGETPKLTESGCYRWTIRGHDVEEFCGVIQRNGLWNPELVAMARVMIDSLSTASQAV